MRFPLTILAPLLPAALLGCADVPDAAPAAPAAALVARPGAPASERPFVSRVAEAELIFQGVVTSVQSALALPGDADGDRLPHTFVRLRVERVFKGRVEGGELTLRFLGGPRPDGGYMISSAAPLFDEGERAILLVHKNGVAKTPLVGWRKGRLRVVDGRVYTDSGNEVHLGDDELRTGRRHALEEALTHRVPGGLLDARRRPDLRPVLADQDGDGEARRLPRPATLVTQAARIEDFAAWLDGVVRRAHPGVDLGALPAVRSADPAAPFVGPSLRPVTPPGEQGQ